MRVVFLDIDGVLNCDSTPNPRNFPYIIDPKLLARLKKTVRGVERYLDAKSDETMRANPRRPKRPLAVQSRQELSKE
jgi:hypothetical protein